MSRLPVSRRRFLSSAAALATVPLLPLPGYGLVRRNPKWSANPFSLGVASGDPTPTGVVLWTRLAPEPLDGGGMGSDAVEVAWQIANDEAFKDIVAQGTAIADPGLAHSVHVEADGLKPGHWYFYRFTAGGEASPVGRTRTAPPVDATPDRLRFAFASCQHFETGFFTALRHLAAEPLDLAIHLGDYIYEGPGHNGGVRKHQGREIESLGDYRTRHAQYKTDKDLQAAHASCPWLMTWDDHEFDNNYANDISEQPNVDPAEFLKRRAAAYQAYYEHMPLRRPAKPEGANMHLYRTVPFGTLADFHVLDTRQFRTDQPCGDRNTAPCGGEMDPNATLLGKEQKAWLKQKLAKSPAAWNVMAQQVMFAPADRQPGSLEAYSMDQWPGYEVERRELLRFFDEAKVKNPVVLTGDIHCNWANNLELPDGDMRAGGRTVATEYVGTSITSGGNGSQREGLSEERQSENPFVKFFNGERGYVSCEVTPNTWHSHFRVVESVTKPDAPLLTRASFVTESGNPGVQGA